MARSVSRSAKTGRFVSQRTAARSPRTTVGRASVQPCRDHRPHPGSGGVPVEVLAALGRIGGNVNQLAHRANAAALNSEPFPVAVQELEAVRRELAGLREALDGDRDLLAQGEREAIEARVREQVLGEVAAERQRRWDELTANARARKRERALRGEPEVPTYERIEGLLEGLRRSESFLGNFGDDQDDE